MGRDGFAYVQTYGQIGDTHYADKAGKQITAIMSMVKQLGG
ncbi:hypothetical protein [Streptomyces venezuelae]|nr:hypothetical protein [Streptomyces venezuelae]